METYLRDFGDDLGLFFCRAVDKVVENRRYCIYCPFFGKNDKGQCICSVLSENDRQFPDFENSTPELLKAYRFAEMAHRGQIRKGSNEPYFVHLMEAAGIARTLTDEEDIIIATLLHDVIEDTGFGFEDLEHEFGTKIAAMVAAVSEDKQRERNADESWYDRKTQAVVNLISQPVEIKTIVLADKLSNIRSTYSEYAASGDAVFEKFNQKDKDAHAWYYRTIISYIEELSGTDAYRELVDKFNIIFGEDI